MTLDFQDDRAIADQFAAALRSHNTTIVIDDETNGSLGRLPCRALWTE